MKKVLKKLNSAAGFTLSEVLVAVLILVMISATALPAALRAYQNAVDAANAQVLLSTTVNALRDELSTAWDVEASGTTITYKSSDTGDRSVISIDEKIIDEKIIMLQEYDRSTYTASWWDGEEGKTTATKRPLVSDAMRQTTKNSGSKMAVYYTGASVSDDQRYVKIAGLQVERDGKTIAQMPGELLIRVMTKTESKG